MIGYMPDIKLQINLKVKQTGSVKQGGCSPLAERWKLVTVAGKIEGDRNTSQKAYRLISSKKVFFHSIDTEAGCK